MFGVFPNLINTLKFTLVVFYWVGSLAFQLFSTCSAGQPLEATNVATAVPANEAKLPDCDTPADYAVTVRSPVAEKVWAVTTANTFEDRIVICAAKRYFVPLPLMFGAAVHDPRITCTKNGEPFTFPLSSTRYTGAGTVELFAQGRDAGNYTFHFLPTGKRVYLELFVLPLRKLHRCPNFLGFPEDHPVENKGNRTCTCLTPTLPIQMSLWEKSHRVVYRWLAGSQLERALEDNRQRISGASTHSLCLQGNNIADVYHLLVITEKRQIVRTIKVYYGEIMQSELSKAKEQQNHSAPLTTQPTSSTAKTLDSQPTATPTLSDAEQTSAQNNSNVHGTPASYAPETSNKTSVPSNVEITTHLPDSAPNNTGTNKSLDIVVSEGDQGQAGSNKEQAPLRGSPSTKSKSLPFGIFIAAAFIITGTIYYKHHKPKSRSDGKSHQALDAGEVEVDSQQDCNSSPARCYNPAEEHSTVNEDTQILMAGAGDMDGCSDRADVQVAIAGELDSTPINVRLSMEETDSTPVDNSEQSAVITDENSNCNGPAPGNNLVTLDNTEQEPFTADVSTDNSSQRTGVAAGCNGSQRTDVAAGGNGSLSGVSASSLSDLDSHNSPPSNLHTSLRKAQTATGGTILTPAELSVRSSSGETSNTDTSPIDNVRYHGHVSRNDPETFHPGHKNTPTSLTNTDTPAPNATANLRTGEPQQTNSTVLGSSEHINWRPLLNAVADEVSTSQQCTTLATQLELMYNPKLVDHLCMNNEKDFRAVAYQLFLSWLDQTKMMPDDKRLEKLQHIFTELVPTTLLHLGNAMNKLLPSFPKPKP